MTEWFVLPAQCVVCGTGRGPWRYSVNDEDVCEACADAVDRANPAWARFRAILEATHA